MDDVLLNYSIYVYTIDMPSSIHGACMPCADGGYTIYLNSCLDETGRLKTLEHELKHIERNDFEKENVQEIEWDAHYA